MQLKQCGRSSTIEEEGIGDIKIGRQLSDVAATCDLVRDSVEMDAEAMPVRVAYFALGADSVKAEIVKEKIWRLEVETPGVASRDSLRGGMPLQALLGREGTHGVSGDGRLFVIVRDHCGLSFRVSPDPTAYHENWSQDQLRALPPESKVASILVTGCSGAGDEDQ